MKQKTLAVVVHDASPVYNSELKEISASLEEAGIDKATVCVIPNHRYENENHPIIQDIPFLRWLGEQIIAGHEIVHHGLEHALFHPLKKRSHKLIDGLYSHGTSEFINLDYQEAFDSIDEGKFLFEQICLQPQGFIAPAHFVSPEAEQAIKDHGFDYCTFVDRIEDYKNGRTIHSPITGLSADDFTVNKVLNIYTRFLYNIYSRIKELPIARFQIHPVDLKDEKAYQRALEIIKETMKIRKLTTYSEFIKNENKKIPIPRQTSCQKNMR
ncbi:DUF2334 domain-containing protein [Nanoarchaeota archaeon]